MKRLFQRGLAMLATVTAVAGITAVPADASTVEPALAYYRIVNYRSNPLVMAVQGASTANNVQVIQADYTTGAPNNDRIGLERQGTDPNSNWYRLIAQHSGKCFAVANASTVNNAAILQAPCTYDSLMNDVFLMETVTLTDDGLLRFVTQFRNLRSSKCILVNGASFIAGAKLQQFTCGANYSGYWNPR